MSLQTRSGPRAWDSRSSALRLRDPFELDCHRGLVDVALGDAHRKRVEPLRIGQHANPVETWEPVRRGLPRSLGELPEGLLVDVHDLVVGGQHPIHLGGLLCRADDERLAVGLDLERRILGDVE